MKIALIVSWALFAVTFAWQADAESFVMRNGVGVFDVFKVSKTEVPGYPETAGKMLKWDVHLDDEEIDRIAAVCKRQ